MLSIIIAAYKEPYTIVKAIKSFTKQDIKEDYEILIISPDTETKYAVNSHFKDNPKVKNIQDPGKGKPNALNIAFKVAKGDILILTDGDVYVSENSINELAKNFKDPKVGAVTGRPISINDKNTKLGFWS